MGQLIYVYLYVSFSKNFKKNAYSIKAKDWPLLLLQEALRKEHRKQKET